MTDETSRSEMLELAKRAYGALHDGDSAAFLALLSSDACRWSNITEKEQPKAELDELMKLEREHFLDKKREDVRIHAIDSGFLVQETIVGRTSGGEPVRILSAVSSQWNAARSVALTSTLTSTTYEGCVA